MARSERQRNEQATSTDCEAPPLTGDARRPSNTLRNCLMIAVAILTIVAFVGSLQNEFVLWDDVPVLVDNTNYQGLSPSHLHWMFTTSFAGHYQPLTWLSHAIETKIWGVNAAGSHFVNLLLHVLSALGVMCLATLLLRAAKPDLGRRAVLIGSAAAAALWAVHPLRVESVVWATERRDVLSGLFLVFAVVLYVRSRMHAAAPASLIPNPQGDADSPGSIAQSGKSARRILLAGALLMYVLSLMSKAVGMTLPVVLLLLDFYPLRRLGPWTEGNRREPAWRILTEKAAFILPAMLAIILAAWAQHDAGAMRSFDDHPIALRIGQAFYGLVFYLWKTAVPLALVPLYEQNPHATALDLPNVIAAAIVLAVTAILWIKRRFTPALLIAWIAYIVIVSPMLGLAQSGPQVVADRYSYLPTIPLMILMAFVIAHACSNEPARNRMIRPMALIGVGVALAMFTSLSRGQTTVWKNTYSLWTHTIAQMPETPSAHINLASYHLKRSEYDLAEQHATIALKTLPYSRVGHIVLAEVAMQRSQLQKAEQHLLIALERRPNDLPQMVNLSRVYELQKRFDEAESLLRKMVKVDPLQSSSRARLAGFLAARGRFEESLAEFDKALKADSPAPDAYYRSGIVLIRMGRYSQAVSRLEDGLRLNPYHNQMMSQLAWTLATCPVKDVRDGVRAISLAKRAAAESGEKNPQAREALAAALAEVGDFTQARTVAEDLLGDPLITLSKERKRRLNDAIDAYRAGRAFESDE